MKKQWSTVLLIALVLIVVIFSVLNVDPVAINFGFSIVQIPLAVVLIGTLLIGVLMAVLLSTAIILQNKNEQKRLTKRITELENETASEKEKLVQQHQSETQSLREENEKDKTEIRELNRRIQNMRTSQTTHTDQVKNDL